VTSSNAFNKFSSPERPVERRDISWLCGGLHEDTGGIPPFKEENPRQPPWRGEGAVALVAPGAKGFFEPGLGGG